MKELSEQIGERLRLAREEAELAIDDVVFQTRLPKSAIVALENEDFSSFVSPVYAKSFLAQYSHFLKVDASLWIDALNPSNFIEGDPLLPVLAENVVRNDSYTSAGSSRSSAMPALWALLFSGILLFSGYEVFKFFELRLGGEKVAPKRPEQVLARPVDPPRAAPAAAPPAAEPVVESPEVPAEEPPSVTPRATVVPE